MIVACIVCKAKNRVQAGIRGPKCGRCKTLFTQAQLDAASMRSAVSETGGIRDTFGIGGMEQVEAIFKDFMRNITKPPKDQE